MSCELISVCQGLEKWQSPSRISARPMMWSQEHLLGCNRGNSQNASVADTRCWLRPDIGGHEHGKHLASFHAGPDIWAQGCLSVLARGMKLGWFSAETKMWVQKYLSQTCRMAGWSLVRVSTETRLRRICRGGRRAGPSLVPCRDWKGG